MDDTIAQPNGIAFSPDYSIVYISDTGLSNITSFSETKGEARLTCDLQAP